MTATTEKDWELTAYCKCVKCCDKKDGTTASGYKLTDSDHHKVCAAPSTFAFGTVITISGGWSGTVTVQDRGGAIKGKRLDIYCKTHDLALQLGRKKKCTIQYTKE
jgi:3D (Asp-Asp-Asp) domain-containing protein